MFNTESYANTVDGEVLRGQKLQIEKLKKYSTPTDYDVVDIDFDRPSSSRPSHVQDINAKNLSKKGYKYTNEYTKRKKQKMLKTGKRKRNSASRRDKPEIKCPIRILELSIPTKRQCLETWRNNQDILPDYMIERLRQMIMDEKPIVQLHDAVDYFKKRKKLKSRLSTSHNTVSKPKQIEQVKTLSAILAYKIIKKLLRPININLNSELKSLSKVIFNEITTMTQYSKIKSNHKIQNEIANKVTIWIASVLEDSSFLQLLEDYEELKRQEEPVWNIIDDLIDKITVVGEPEIIMDNSTIELTSSIDSKSSIDEEKSKTTENSEKSEDQEITNIYDFTTNNNEKELKGKEIKQSENLSQYVRDMIDDIIDAHTSGVEKSPLDTLIDKDDIIPKYSIESDLNISIDQRYSIRARDNNDSEYFDKFIKDIIDEIVVQRDSIDNLEVTNKLDTYKEAQIVEDKISTQSSQKEFVQNLENETKEINVYDTGTIEDISENEKTENDTVDLVNYEMMDSSLDIKNNKQNELNDEVISLDQQEGSLDDSIKKVKFSHINIGNKIMKSLNVDRNNNSSQESVIMQQKLISSIDENVKPVLYIAPPNNNLLSDADESWPENLSFPVLKASISVSKSIQSLGKIIESEEKTISSPEEYGDKFSKDNLLSFQNESDINENLKLSSNMDNKKIISSDTYLTMVEFERFDKRDNSKVIDQLLNTTKHKDTDIAFLRDYDDESNKNNLMDLLKEPQADIKDTVINKIKENKPSNLEVHKQNFSNTHILPLPAIVDIERMNDYNKSIICDDIVAINENELKDEIINTSKHKNLIARLTIKHLPLINIDNICNNKLTHEKSLQTDKDVEQKFYPLSKGTQRSEITKRKYHSNFNPEGHHITELKLRQWCLGLESVIENLEMWSDWIENTCTYILFLKYKEYKGKKIQQKKYKNEKLRKNIELDAKLWLKFSKNIKVGLYSYRNYYKNFEVRITSKKHLKRYLVIKTF